MLVGQVAMSLLPAPSNSTTIEDVMQIPPATYRIIIFGKVRHALILSLMITFAKLAGEYDVRGVM